MTKLPAKVDFWQMYLLPDSSSQLLPYESLLSFLQSFICECLNFLVKYEHKSLCLPQILLFPRPLMF